ncbi:hypothetical protein Vafri_14293 [Volvox africanus]|uniref:O-fucosyltransferase family protein n=1 Tax=Volvox africanus TaxID=51714 RepID=A0A8J4F6L6_9CHLO|nr:hypothetical protein Vafri_14293 [Volvox africanus]
MKLFLLCLTIVLWSSTIDAFNQTLCNQERSLWMDEYREFHRINRVAQGARYLVYYCGPNQSTCGGTGDRVRGMLYLLRVAAVHRMIFIAKWSQSNNLPLILEPNEIDWRTEGLPDSVLSTIGKEHNTFSDAEFFTTVERGGVHLERWAQTPIHTTTAWPASIVDHRIWNTTLWWSNFLTLLGPLGGVPKDRRERWLREFEWYIDISSCWWHYAFKPTEAVVRKAQESLEAAYVLQPGITPPSFVAWHWRTGGQLGETTIIRAENQEFFKPRLQQLISCINCVRAMALSHAVTVPVLIVTDLNLFRPWIRSGGMGPGVTTLPSIAVHVGQTDGEPEHLVNIMAEALVISKAKCLLISQSGFSNIALMMRTGPLCFEHIDVCLQEQESLFAGVKVR